MSDCLPAVNNLLFKAIAKAWSDAGAKGVVLVGRDAKKLESTADDLTGPSLVATGNIANETDVDGIFKHAIERFGRVDTVINAAGTMNTGPIGQIEPSKWWQDYVRVNFSRTTSIILTEAGNQRQRYLQPRSLPYKHDLWPWNFYKPCLSRRYNLGTRPICVRALTTRCH
jgi:NAD(P)-dependent dehydrogenase (short-subunit alcohol dehydrogenase family)